MEDVNKERRNFISLSELGYGPLKFSFRRVRLHLKKGIIASKTEETQIHFLCGVLVTVASLDLKVPNMKYARTVNAKVILRKNCLYSVTQTGNIFSPRKLSFGS